MVHLEELKVGAQLTEGFGTHGTSVTESDRVIDFDVLVERDRAHHRRTRDLFYSSTIFHRVVESITNQRKRDPHNQSRHCAEREVARSLG